METIKAYIDIEQSKKLAEILPIESADMYYYKGRNNNFVQYPHFVEEYQSMTDRNIVFSDNVIPCWSLAALLNILPNYQLQTQDDGIGILCSCNGKFNIITADNPVDTCYELILKLHEKKLLFVKKD